MWERRSRDQDSQTSSDLLPFFLSPSAPHRQPQKGDVRADSGGRDSVRKWPADTLQWVKINWQHSTFPPVACWMCSDWGTEPSDCRCAGAEIGSNGPCSLEGEVVVSVPVHGRCGSLERTGTAGDDVPSIQILHPSCPSLTAHSSRPPPTPSPLPQKLHVEADCTFRELLLADGYTRFLSSHHGSPLSLAPKQSPGRHAVPFTRFLPLRNTLAGESASDQPPNNPRLFNVDSEDLLGMAHASVISPQFSAEKWREVTADFVFWWVEPADLISL